MQKANRVHGGRHTGGARSVARKRTLLALSAASVLLAGRGPVEAANTIYSWDPAGSASPSGGTGAWDSSSSFWLLDGTTTPTAWPNTNPSSLTAAFGGTAGTTTIPTATDIYANSLVFGTTGYIIDGADATAVLHLNGTAPTIAVPSGLTASFSSAVSSSGFTKMGTGTLVLSTNSDTVGGLVINAGTVTLNALAGSLNSADTLTFGNATSYGGSGVFNYNNTTSAGSTAQTLGVVTFTSGEGTVQSTRTAAQNVSLTFTSFTAPASGATGATANFVTSGGTPGTNNSIILTGQGSGFINQSTFFDGGITASANYAYYDTTVSPGFVRGINYGVDSNSQVSATGATFATNVTTTNSFTTTGNQKITGAITAQTTTTLGTLQIPGAFNVTLVANNLLTVNGILKSGGNAATISGGTLSSVSGQDLVVHSDLGDTLTISTPIVNGTNNLVKSGPGTLNLTVSNTYTGTTYVNAGTIASNASTSSITGATGTGPLVINGGGISNSANSGSPVFTLTNSSQTWAGDFSLNGGGASAVLTVQGAVTLTGDRTVSISGSTGSGAGVNPGGAIGDGGNGYSLTWAGNGSARVSLGTNASTYSGRTTILANQIQFRTNVLSNQNGPFGNAASDILLGATSGSVTAAILSSNTTVNFSRNIILQSGGIGGLIIGNQIGSSPGGAGAFNDSGNITLGTANSTGRGVTLHSGTFSGNISDPVGLTGSPGAITIEHLNASNTNPDQSFAVIFSGNNTFKGGVILSEASALSITATLGLNSPTALGTGSLQISTPGTGATLALNSTAITPITLSTNNLQFWNGDFSFTGGQILNMGTGAVSLGNANIATRTVTANGANSLIIGGVISNGSNGTTQTVGLTKAGTGILVLSGSNAYTGATTITAGTLEIGYGGTTGNIAASTGSSLSNSGTLAINRSDSFILDSTIIGSSGIISGGGAFAQAGSGTITINNSQAYTGATIVSGGGTLKLDANTGALNGSTGTALTFSGAGTLNGTGGTFINDNTNVVSGDKTQAMGALTFSAGDGNVKSTLGGGGASSTTLTFSSLATRTAGATGNFVMTDGTNGTTGAGGTNAIVLAGQANGFINKGIFFGGGTASANYAFYDTGGFIRGISYGADPNTESSPGGATLADGATMGSGFTASTGNVEILGDITGQTAASFGTIQIPSNYNITLTGTQTAGANGGGILKSGGNASTITGSTIAGGASELVIRVDQSTDSLAINSVVGGSGGLTKSGAGVLSLAGINTYTGSTILNAGTTLFDNIPTAVSAVTVNPFAAIGGIGKVNGALTLGGNAMLAPGDADTTGKLTVGGAISVTGTGQHFNFRVNGETPGTSYDQVSITTGNVALGSLGLLSVTMGIFSATAGDTIYLVDNTGTGTTTGTFAGLAEGAAVTTANGVSWDITYAANDTNNGNTANDVALVAVVPEPSSIGLIALGGIGVLAHRRRRVSPGK